MQTEARSAADVSSPVTARGQEWAVVVGVALCTMLAPLNSTMIVVALPRIVRDFGTTVSAGGWLITLYLIAMASCQPLAGKLGDRWGRRRLILAALVAFAVVSVGAAAAPTLPSLIVFRVLQAVSAGLALPNGMALVREIVPAERRGSRFGIVASAAGVAAGFGPPLGGVLTQLGGWRTIFAANLVLLVPAFVIGWQTFPRSRRHAVHPGFDVWGAVLLSLLLVGLAALLIRVPAQAHALSGGWGVALLLLLALFLRHELRAPDPVLRLQLFGNPTITGGNLGIALSNLAMYTTLIAVPLLEGERSRLKPVQVGLLLAAMSATNLIAAPVGGRLSDRFGRRWPTVAGLALAVPGLTLLVLSGNNVSVRLLVVSLAIAGFGLGLGWAGLQTAVVEAAPPREAGMAAGLFSTSRYFGSIVGTSVLGGLVGGHASRHDFVPIFVMAVAATVAAVVACLWLEDRPER